MKAKKYDPDGMNDARAQSAGEAIKAFVAATSTDPQDALADLLCNLRHWADRNGYAFDTEDARGAGHYEAETSKDGGW